MDSRDTSPLGAAGVAEDAPTYTGDAGPQIEPPMLPGMAGIVPEPVGMTSLAAVGEQSPRGRSAPAASFSIGTPAPTPSGAEGVRLPASPASPEASGSKKRAASPSPARVPRPQGDPWAAKTDNAAVMAQMTAVMSAMQRTIDALTAQLAAMQGGSSGGGKEKHDKDADDMPVMHHKDVDKPSKFGGQNWMTWSIDFMNFLGRKNAKWKGILQVI